MRRSLITLGLALLASSLVMWLVGGWKAVLLSGEIMLPVGATALLIAHAVDAGRLRMSALRHRFQLSVGLALGQLLAAMLVGAIVMFVSPEDAKTTIGILVFAGLIAARAAQILLHDVLTDVAAVSRGLHDVGNGERESRIDARSSREFLELAESANLMTTTLAREERARDSADAARRQVVAAVSHDLRTPLASLRLLAQALEDELVDPETARRYVKTIGVNVRALGTLVDDLFEFSRLNAGDFTWSTEAVPLGSLVGEALDAIRPAADAGGVAVRAEVSSDLAPARANPEKLGRVLANLLTNAIHHTPPDGSVVVRAHEANGSAEIEVLDTGAGIPPTDRAKVFEPFYRGGEGSARGHGGGSGLGLAIAQSIVEAHGGRIWLSDSARGTAVRFTLPLSD